jgi:hypothetical protein
MYLRFTLLVFLAFATADASAQFWKRKRHKAETEASVQEPTSLNPSASRKEFVPKAARSSAKGPTYGAEQEFYERMEKLEKTRRKEEHIMQKPQYSNPLYFGHKHPPKKRKPSKMKYCKVCGIRH